MAASSSARRGYVAPQQPRQIDLTRAHPSTSLFLGERQTSDSAWAKAHPTPKFKMDYPLERFTVEMAFICASEDKAGKEQKRSHSGLRRVFVTQAADAATSR